MTEDHRKRPPPSGYLLKLTDRQRFNRALTEIVDEGQAILAATGVEAANDYLSLNGVPAPVIARVLSRSARKRPR